MVLHWNIQDKKTKIIVQKYITYSKNTQYHKINSFNKRIVLFVLYCTVLYCIVLYYIVLYCAVFNCTAMSGGDCSRCVSLGYNASTAPFTCRWCDSSACRSDLTCTTSSHTCPPPHITAVRTFHSSYLNILTLWWPLMAELYFTRETWLVLLLTTSSDWFKFSFEYWTTFFHMKFLTRSF